MKQITQLLLTLLCCGMVACNSGNNSKDNMNTKVKIETSAGDVVVKLYDETPKHRDNFIKLVKNGSLGD